MKLSETIDIFRRLFDANQIACPCFAKATQGKQVERACRAVALGAKAGGYYSYCTIN